MEALARLLEERERLADEEVDALGRLHRDLLVEEPADDRRGPRVLRVVHPREDRVPATSAWSPATSLAMRTAARLIASTWSAYPADAELLLARVERERLEHVGTGPQELLVELAVGLGMLDGHLGGVRTAFTYPRRSSSRM